MSIISMNSITITISLLYLHLFHSISIIFYILFKSIYQQSSTSLGFMVWAVYTTPFPGWLFSASMEECGVVGEQRSTIDHLAPNMSNARPSKPWLIKNWELPNSDHWLLSICWSPMINSRFSHKSGVDIINQSHWAYSAAKLPWFLQGGQGGTNQTHWYWIWNACASTVVSHVAVQIYWIRLGSAWKILKVNLLYIWLEVYLPLWKILVSWDYSSQCMDK